MKGQRSERQDGAALSVFEIWLNRIEFLLKVWNEARGVVVDKAAKFSCKAWPLIIFIFFRELIAYSAPEFYFKWLFTGFIRVYLSKFSRGSNSCGVVYGNEKRAGFKLFEIKCCYGLGSTKLADIRFDELEGFCSYFCWTIVYSNGFLERLFERDYRVCSVDTVKSFLKTLDTFLEII